MYDDKEFIEEKYFPKGSYRKIRKKLIQDIVNARIDEIIDIIMNKNINIQYFKKDSLKVYIIIQDKIISDNFICWLFCFRVFGVAWGFLLSVMAKPDGRPGRRAGLRAGGPAGRAGGRAGGPAGRAGGRAPAAKKWFSTFS